MAGSKAEFPYPVITPETQPFWESAGRRALELPRCSACGKFFFPPSAFCPKCWSDQVVWETIAGTGHIVSFVTFRRLFHPAFAQLLPYSVAVIECDEGPRLLSRITELAEGDVPQIGARVRVVYEELDPGHVLPLFAMSEN